MSGPTKLNSTTSTTIPTTMMASLFWAKVRRISAHGLPVVTTSPPSGISSISAWVGATVLAATRSGSSSALPAPSGSCCVPEAGPSVPDPRIENRIANVRQQIADHGDHPHQHRDPEHHLVVAAQSGLIVLIARPRVVEHLLDDQRAGEHQGNVQPHQRDHR